jgi:hypothetical protein
MTLSAFDLIVLGTLVLTGGGLLIAKGRRPHRATGLHLAPLSSEMQQEIYQHLHTVAGVRWLTVGSVALVLGITRGEEASYFFGPFIDAALHTVVLSLSWVATSVRTRHMTNKAFLDKIVELNRPASDSVPRRRSPLS